MCAVCELVCMSVCLCICLSPHTACVCLSLWGLLGVSVPHLLLIGFTPSLLLCSAHLWIRLTAEDVWHCFALPVVVHHSQRLPSTSSTSTQALALKTGASLSLPGASLSSNALVNLIWFHNIAHQSLLWLPYLGYPKLSLSSRTSLSYTDVFVLFCFRVFFYFMFFWICMLTV